jgi:hypothetical protein
MRPLSVITGILLGSSAALRIHTFVGQRRDLHDSDHDLCIQFHQFVAAETVALVSAGIDVAGTGARRLLLLALGAVQFSLAAFS